MPVTHHPQPHGKIPMTTIHNAKLHTLFSPWWYLLIGNLLGLIAIGIYWYIDLQLPTSLFIGAAFLLIVCTSLAAAPLMRFVILDWEARYHEFANRLNNESLIAYLQQFWEKRTIKDKSFVGWHLGDCEESVTQNQINHSMEKVFDAIYYEQYGRVAFVAPILLLTSIIFASTAFSIQIYLNKITLLLESPAVAISSIAGAYMYVVSDSIQSVRQRNLNASSIYWYTLRMLLAIPIGIALTYPVTEVVKPFVAFGLGALPMDEILKLLRRLTSKELNLSESAEKTDQLIKLEGVTVRISSILIAEGVDSIDQIITVDPVLLSIRTGLPFKFILQLGAQAIVRRYLGITAEKLIPLGLADARSIAALINDLDSNDDVVQNRAKAVLAAATSLVMPTDLSATIISNYSTECLEYNFRQIANNNYTKFIQGKLLSL